MNNKIVNLALLAENAGKLDKSKVNINNLFNEIKKILEYLNTDDEGDFKEKRQEFIDKLTPIINKIDDILLKYIDFLRNLIASEQEFEGSQVSDLRASTEDMKRRSGASGGSSGGGASGSGSGYTPSSAASSPQQASNTPSVQSTETVKSTEQPFKSSSLTDANSQKNLISDVFARLRGNGSTTPSYSGGLSGTTSVPSANLGTGAPTSTEGSSTTPADNLSKLSTGGEAASNKVLDDLLKSSVSPDEQILSETDKTLEEDLPMLTEGENNPVTDNIATEDTALTDLSTSTLDDSLPTDNGSSSDWIKYAGLGTLGLGAVGLGTAALMSKNKKDDELNSEELEETTNSDWSTASTTGYNDDSFNTASSNW